MTSSSSSNNSNGAEEHLSASCSTAHLDAGSDKASAPIRTRRSCCEISNCQGSALWREIANGKRRVCRQHKETGVAYSQLVPICAQEVCTLQAAMLIHTIRRHESNLYFTLSRKVSKILYCGPVQNIVRHTIVHECRGDGVLRITRGTHCTVIYPFHRVVSTSHTLLL